MSQMKSDWEAWAHIQSGGAVFWKRMKDRSCFNLKKVQQVFQLAQAAQWRLTDEILDIVKKDFSGITQTKLVEDGVRAGRVAEVNKGFNKRVKPERLYDQLVKGDVACEKHRFPQLDFASAAIPKGVESKSSRGLFALPPKQTPKEFRKVVSTKTSADYDYHSPAPLKGTQSLEDLELTKWCMQQKQLHLAPACFLSILVAPYKIIMRNKAFHRGAWFLALKQFTGLSVLAIPLSLDECVHEGKKYFLLQKIRMPYWLPVVEATAWSCCTFVFRSPLGLKVTAGKWHQAPGCVLQATCEPTQLLKVSARNAFWTIPKTALVMVARHVGVDVNSAGALPQIVLDMAEKVLDR